MNILADDGSRIPTVTIRDMPVEMRPREKLLQHGAGALSNAELVALFLSSGVRGRSAIEIGDDLLRKFGSLGSLASIPASELAREHGLGVAKASKLAATFEMGARIAREQISAAVLDSPEAIYQHFGPQLSHLHQEQVMVSVVDARLRHMASTVISVGTVNESSAHPREVLRPVITRNGYGLVLLHNHPSGDPSPSKADEMITRRIAEAASLLQVRLIDHVIIGKPISGRSGYFSFREAGILD